MKYTQNFHLKLAALGFEFSYDHKNDEETPVLYYEVWKKGIIEVTIEHSPGRTIQANIIDHEDIDVANMKELTLIDKILNKNS